MRFARRTFLGGCADSTAGGMKVLRWLMIWKQGEREIVRLMHPSAEVPVKLDDFTTMSATGKWICIVAMVLGRLEIFPLLVLVSPTFWRR